MPLEEITLRSADDAYERTAWFYRGPEAAHHLGIWLDGEFYLERVEALPLIETLSDEGVIPTMSWLFIASGGAEARHSDFTFSTGSLALSHRKLWTGHARRLLASQQISISCVA